MITRHYQVEAILSVYKQGRWHVFCKYHGQWMRAASPKLARALQLIQKGCRTIDVTRASLSRLSLVK